MTKKEILPFATTWMDLESNMLSEISQTEKGKIHGITCMWNLKKKKKNLVETENRLVVAREGDWGERNG